MANNKSAEKRIEINRRNRLQNRFYKSSVRTLIKVFLKDLEIYKVSKNLEDQEKVKKILSSVYSLIDKGTKKNVFHKNAAAKKSKISCLFKSCLNSSKII
ncbi:MAG: 30S ribosomal protein S20 [Anaerotruncus sp.]|nr:30S ribosomal protein S20 [Anaerotruncus sp.]